jgi:membrane fusion protein, copper/silver efflux system
MSAGRRWPGWASAVAGLAAGAALTALAPDRAIFEDASADDGAVALAGDGGRYACPMLCTFSAKPGTCPVCGMDMERIVAGAATREQQRRMGLETITVQAAPAAVVVRAAGTAVYDDRFSQTVIARVAGRIVKRHDATFGCCQEVAEGDPVVDLFSIEAYQAQAELAAALRSGDQGLARIAEDRLTRWNLAHVARAIRDGAAPDEVVTIRSPGTGQAWLDDADMVDRTLMVGAEVAAGTTLLKLVDGFRLTLVFHVPESRSAWLRVGQRVHLSSDDAGELPDVQAVIGRVANELDPEIRAREVRVFLDDGRRRILPGSLLTARIQAVLGADLQPADAANPAAWGSFPQVPETAVLSTGVRHVAWRVRQRRPDGSAEFEPVSVALGPRLEDPSGVDRYVIRAGLAVGDEVATRGAFLVDSQAQLAGSPSLLFGGGAVRSAPAHAH